MMEFKEYDIIRVKQLLLQDRWWTAVQGRAPEVGDIGTVVDIPQGSTSWLTAECVDENGQTIWVADFISGELELVEIVG